MAGITKRRSDCWAERICVVLHILFKSHSRGSCEAHIHLPKSDANSFVQCVREEMAGEVLVKIKNKFYVLVPAASSNLQLSCSTSTVAWNESPLLLRDILACLYLMPCGLPASACVLDWHNQVNWHIGNENRLPKCICLAKIPCLKCVYFFFFSMHTINSICVYGTHDLLICLNLNTWTFKIPPLPSS